MQVYFWSIEDGNKHACPTMQGSSRFDFYLLTNHRRLTNEAGEAHFLSAQMALVSTFFQMCIVLGMYNIDVLFKNSPYFGEKLELSSTI